MKFVILATRNDSKAEQIRAIFKGSSYNVVTMTEAEIEGEAVEDGETLEQNALKKAMYVHDQCRWMVMADDTGLFIESLGGAPGVRAARWAGEHATTEEITAHTLRQLEGKSNRRATFRTVVGIVRPDGLVQTFDGEVNGQILAAPRTKPQPKMPYSPIFVPDGTDQVWGEMTIEFQNRISHRGIAFRKALEYLEGLG